MRNSKKYIFDVKEKNILHNMKNILNLTTTGLFLALAVFVSCGGGSDPVEEIDPCQVNSGLLTVKAATISKVTNPSGIIVTTDWTGFTVNFTGNESGGNYSTNVASLSDNSLTNIWAASGTWTFDATDTNCKTIIANGGFTSGTRSIVISAITASGLKLAFNVPVADTGRTLGIPGDWFFEFAF